MNLKIDMKKLDYIPVADGPKHLLDKSHVMMDVETLSLSPDAAVWQIGAAIWNPSAPDTVMVVELTVHPDDVIKLRHGHVDEATIKWQADKNSANWSAAYQVPMVEGITRGQFVHGVCGLYQSFFNKIIALLDGKPEDALFWAKSTYFDFPIIEHLYKQSTAYNLPWKYWNVHELRTFMLLRGIANKSFSHAGGDDAFNQLNIILREFAHGPN